MENLILSILEALSSFSFELCCYTENLIYLGIHAPFLYRYIHLDKRDVGENPDRTMLEFDVIFLVTFGALFRWLSCAMTKIETVSENIWVAMCIHISFWTTIAPRCYLIWFGHTEALLLKKGHKTDKIPALHKLTHIPTYNEYHQVPASIAMYWPSTIKYQLVSLYNSSSRNAEWSKLDDFSFDDSFDESRRVYLV